MRKQIREITHGAMALALIGAVMLINVQAGGLLNMYIAVFMPVLIIPYIIRYGFRSGVIVSFAALIIAFIIQGFIGLFYVAQACIIALAYGWGVLKQRSGIWLITASIIVSFIAVLIETYLLAKLVGYDFIEDMRLVAEMVANQLRPIVADLPADFEVIMLSLIPLTLMVQALIQGIAVHVFSLIVVRRLKITLPPGKPLYQYRLPKPLAYLALLALFAASLLFRFSTEEWMRSVSVNLMLVGTLVFGIDAFIVIILFARYRGMKWLPMMALLGLFALPFIVIYGLIGIGLLDTFTDFRQRILIK